MLRHRVLARPDGQAIHLKTYYPLGAIHLLRSHRGGGGGLVKTNDSTDRLREWDSNKGGEGVQKSENYANVINGCPLITATE